jgi:hypothetical protein
MTTFFLALAISFIPGYLLCRVAWPDAKNNPADRLLCIALGAGIGCGLSSCIYFLIILSFSPVRSGIARIDFFIHACLGLLLLGLMMKKKRFADSLNTRLKTGSVACANPSLTTIYFLAALFALAASAIIYLQSPYGEQDAWQIWNIRAKVLYDAPEPWHKTFQDVGYHPDYPLLIPAMIARCWQYVGSSPNLVPAVLNIGMTFAAIFLLTTSLTVIKDKKCGLLAGLVLLGTPFYIREGAAAQQADVIFSYYVMAPLVLLALKDMIFKNSWGLAALAGLMAGLAAWTKNEGFLFILCLSIARTGSLFIRPAGRPNFAKELLFFLAGLIPVLAVIVYFKACIAPPNDLLSGQGADLTRARLLDGSRYILTAKAFISQMLSFGRWQIYPVALGIYLLFCGRDVKAENKTPIVASAGVIALMLGGYFMVYITSPLDLAYHLKTSLHRILLHLWPLTLFTFFLVIRPAGTEPT